MSPTSFVAPPSAAIHAALVTLAVELGRAIGDARERRGWSRARLAEAAGVSRSLVYLVERGEPASIEAYVRIASALRRRLDAQVIDPRRRAGPVVAGDPVHSAMAEIEAARLRAHGLEVAIDEPYQHYQFAGRADLLAWDIERRALLHIENRTRFPDLQEAAGSFNAKRAYLPDTFGARVGVRGWTTVTHVMATLWSAEVLHVLRLRRQTFRALCPDGCEAFAAWWGGAEQPRGTRCTLVLMDPAPSSRQRPWVGVEALDGLRPRHHGYAEAVAALRRTGLL
jgi:transcriptional regulator with XRE-family HTH domain